jgi:hypothetical protein
MWHGGPLATRMLYTYFCWWFMLKMLTWDWIGLWGK